MLTVPLVSMLTVPLVGSHAAGMSDLASRLDAGAFPEARAHCEEVARARAALADRGELTFLEADEVFERRDQLREENSDFLDHVLYVAEDRGGVLYGIWLRGRLAGMWSMYDPDEIDLSPAWRSTDDFIDRVKHAELRPGLPDVEGRASAADHERFAEVVRAYRGNLEGEDTDPDDVLTMFFAYSVVALTPRKAAGELVAFLDYPNQWIQERAASTLGAYGFTEAADALRALAAKSGNGALAARGALKKMNLS